MPDAPPSAACPPPRKRLQMAVDEALSLPDDAESATTTNGLAHLVLSLVNLLHELLEKQAIRRMEQGTLTDDEVERIGRTLQQQAAEIEHLCDVFDLDPSDLSLPLGTIETNALETS